MKLLNDKEKKVLNLFGNLYPIFYEIIESKKVNYGFFNKGKFLEKIDNTVKKNLKNYYKKEDKIDIHNLLTDLIDIELSDLN